jgi:hypothetical protein
MRKNKINVCFHLMLILLGSLLASCEKDKGPVIIKPVMPVDSMIRFERDIQPIFNEHCIVCHNTSHPYLDLREGLSWNDLWFPNPHGIHAPYVDTITPENSVLIGRLRGLEYSIMPPNSAPLRPSLIDTIAKWMRQGARND